MGLIECCVSGAALSEFTTNRSVDAKAMCDLAFYNYIEVEMNFQITV